MFKFILLMSLSPLVALAQVSSVNQGSPIQASKMNEVISSVNDAHVQIDDVEGDLNSAVSNLQTQINGKQSTLAVVPVVVASGIITANATFNHENEQRVIFSTEEIDNTNSYNPATGYFVCPRNGKYQMSAVVQFNSYAWGGGVTVRIAAARAGVIEKVLHDYVVPVGITQYMALQGVPTILSCTTGQTLHFSVYHNSGSPKIMSSTNLRNHMSIHWIAE